MVRTLIATLIAPVMRATGFRFSKSYRHGETRWHRLVYACVDTTGANWMAGDFASLVRVLRNEWRAR